MALIKEHEKTEQGREARRRNGRKSRGAATPAGKERSRAAHLRHGIYSQERDEALRALGEDPADLAELIAGAYEQWRPANAQQARVVERTAHLQWRMDRAARRQDHVQAEHLRKVEADRREKTLNLRYHENDMVGFLSTLIGHAARPDFFAPPAYIAQFSRAFREEMQERLEQILELLHQLRGPENPIAAGAPLPADAASDECWQEFLALMEERGIEAVPRPDIEVAEGEERSELRERLRYLAKQELQAVEEAWEPFFAKYLKPMTLAERDTAVLAVDRQLEVLRREEESCTRQFWRLSNLLMKWQDRAEEEPSEVEQQEAGVGRQETGVEGQESGVSRQEPGAGPNDVRPAGIDVPAAPNGVRPTATDSQNVAPNDALSSREDDELAGQNGVGTGTPADVPSPSWPCPSHGQDARSGNPNIAARENAGTSGDVDENKEVEKKGSGVRGQVPANKQEDPMAA